jgi:hypothetical protein
MWRASPLCGSTSGLSAEIDAEEDGKSDEDADDDGRDDDLLFPNRVLQFLALTRLVFS